jgi:hypothetical protein
MLTLYLISTQRPHEEQLFVLVPAILLYGALRSWRNESHAEKR